MIPNLDQLIWVCLIAFGVAGLIVWLIVKFTSVSDNDANEN
ncbi:hypothetical protein [Alteromonas sediminis]|nr:hypothetical protein [Alteromonas sediminis]